MSAAVTCTKVTTTLVQHRDVWQQISDAAFTVAMGVVILCLSVSLIWKRHAQ